MAKKKKKISKLEKNEQKGNRRLFLALVAIFCIIAVFLLLKNNIKSYSFDEAVTKVSSIDAAANFSFSYFDNGFDYLMANPPTDPLNSGEIDPIVKSYSGISGDRQTNLFINFRKNFLTAYKYFIYSHKTYKADVTRYGISCKNAAYFNESIINRRIATEKINTALTSIEELKQKFPEDFMKLEISDKDLAAYSAIPVDIESEANYQVELFNKFCENKTGKII